MTTEKAAPSDIAETHLVDDLSKLKVLADPLRVRILEALVDEARTTKQVAQHLGEKTTKLYHHVDALEKAGFVRLESTRQNRGTLEKYYRAVARVFRAEPSLFSVGGDEDDSWQFVSARLFEQSAAELRAVPRPDESAGEVDETQALIANLLVSATQSEIEELRQRLQDFVDEISQPAEDDGTDRRERHRLVIGFYPLGS